ncbi:MAG: hypothetical protein JXN63_08065 [Candidatus Delongbacteria bacterium]|nr:hypothetical protein [Candidatus Delongbacteria bacterium]
MKKLITAVLAVTMIFLISCGTAGTKEKSLKESALAKNYAPESSMILMSFSSLELLFSAFDVQPNSVMGEPVPENVKAEMTEALGFNPADPLEYDKIGLDIKREFGLILSDLKVNGSDPEMTSADIGFLFPVKKGADSFGYIKNRMNSLQKEGVTVTENDGLLRITVEGQENISVSVKSDGDYLAFNLSINSASTADMYFVSPKHLSDSPNYKEVAKEISMGSDFSFYLDAQKLMAGNAEALNSLAKQHPSLGTGQMGSFDMLKHNRGSGIVCDLSSSDLVIRSVGFADPEHIMYKLSKAENNKSVITGIEKKPALLLAFVINAKEYLDYILKTLPEESVVAFENEIQSYKDMTGVDIRTDFINELAGSINLGIFDGATVNLMQYNSVLNFNMKDRNKFIAIIDKVAPMANIQKMSPEAVAEMIQGKTVPENTDLYSINLGMTFMYIVVEGNNVSICTSKELSADAVDKNNAGFISKLDKKLSEGLKNDINYFYIDFNESYLATKNIYQFFAGMSGGENVLNEKVDGFVNKFDYLYAYGNIDGQKVNSELIVKTKFSKPFFQALKEEITKLQQ